MRRVLKFVALPLLVALLVAGGLWWLLTPRPRAVSFAAPDRVFLEFDATGARAALQASNKGDASTLVVCDTQTGAEISRFGPPDCDGARLLADGRVISWIGGDLSELIVRSHDLRVQTDQLLRTRVGRFRFLACAADGKTVAFTSDEPRQVEVWDLESQQCLAVIPLHSDPQMGWRLLSLADDGALLAVTAGFTTTMGEDKPLAVILYDARTGRECDRLVMPENIVAFPSFERGGRVMRLTENRLSHWHQDPVTGQRIPQMMHLTWAKFYDLSGSMSFPQPRIALARDPQGEVWLAPSQDKDWGHIENAAGDMLSKPFKSNADSLGDVRIIPGTTLLVMNEQPTPSYPDWARWASARLGIPLNWQRHEQAILVDWRTGETRILRSKPDFNPGPGVSRLAGYHFGVSPDGRVLSLNYQTEDGCWSEFWDVARLTRPWWLITIATVLATVLCWLALYRLERRARA